MSRSLATRKAALSLGLLCSVSAAGPAPAQQENVERVGHHFRAVALIAVLVLPAACLQAAIESYESAKMSGLCHEGAWDLVVDAIKTLDVDAVLRELSS